MGVNPYGPVAPPIPQRARTPQTTAPGGSMFGSGSMLGNYGSAVRSYGSQQQQQRAAGPVASNPYGSESGPGFLEDRYNKRATGTDPYFEYSSKRGMESLGNQYSAAGGFNSGAARRGESDFMANLVSQRESALDSLAGGASRERQGRLDSMFGTALGLAGGQAGTVTPYALGGAGAMSAADQAYLDMMLNKAGVQGKARQGALNTGINIAKTAFGYAGGKPGG